MNIDDFTIHRAKDRFLNSYSGAVVKELAIANINSGMLRAIIVKECADSILFRNAIGLAQMPSRVCGLPILWEFSDV